MSSEKSCSVCLRSGLGILLTRPGLLANDPQLVAAGSNAIKTHPSALQPLQLPKPEASRYILRSLRAGYLHVYYPKHPISGQAAWEVFRISEEGTLFPESHPDFKSTAKLQCSTPIHHISTRVLAIPQAHLVDSVWLAYSANLWNDKLKAQNKANPAAMQEIKPKAWIEGGTLPTTGFKASVENIKTHVAEYGVAHIEPPEKDLDTSVFAFVPKPAADAQQAIDTVCGRSPKSKGKGLVLVLPDPVALAAEAAHLVTRKVALKVAVSQRDDIKHPLNSLTTLQSLRRIVIASKTKHMRSNSYGLARPGSAAGSITTYPQFVKIVERGHENNLFWQPLTDPEDLAKAGPNTGLITNAHLEKAIHAKGQAFGESQWASMAKHYDQAKSDAFMKKLTTELQTYDTAIEKLEGDWASFAHAFHTLFYFEKHFDDTDPNTHQHANTYRTSAGQVYIAEAHRVFGEGVHTAKGRKVILAQLELDISNPSAIVLRAFAGNQQALFKAFQEAEPKDGNEGLNEAEAARIASEPNKGLYDIILTQDGKLDKTYDTLKAILLDDKVKEKLKDYKGKQFSWLANAAFGLSGGYGTVFTGSSGLMSAISGVVFGYITETATEKGIPAQALKYLKRNETIMRFSACLNSIANAVHKKLTAPVRPILVHATMEASQAAAVMMGRQIPNLPVSTIKSKKQSFTVSFLTDSEALKKAVTTTQAATQASAVRVWCGEWLTEAIRMGNGKGTVQVVFGLKELQKLIDQTQRTQAVKAFVNKQFSEELKSLRMLGTNLEVKMALGTLFFQGVMFWKNYQEWKKKDYPAFMDSLDLVSSTAGTMGALGEIAQALAQRTAQIHWRIAAYKAGISLLGAIGCFADAVDCWRKLKGNVEKANYVLAGLYAGAAASYFLGGAFGVGFMLNVAYIWITRQLVISSAIIATGEGVVSILGLSLTGWGLVLAGIGLVFHIGAIYLEPTLMEEWIKASYFGKQHSYKTWDEEYKAYCKAMEKASAQALPTVAKRPSSEMVSPFLPVFKEFNGPEDLKA